MIARQRRQRGFAMIEMLLSLAAMLLGLAGLMRVAVAWSQGSSNAQRYTQAQARAQQVLEAIRAQPASVLGCLATQPATSWTTCEAQCLSALGAGASSRACVFVSLQNGSQDTDATNQQYVVYFDPADATRSTWLAPAGTSGRLYEAEITLGWNDNGGAAPVSHRVTLRSAVFR